LRFGTIALIVIVILAIIATTFAILYLSSRNASQVGTTTATIAPGNITMSIRTQVGLGNVSSEVKILENGVVLLPYPRIRSDVISVEQALAYRRSIREYLPKPITIFQLSQLLWAAYGINEVVHGFKTCPSAGALYPLAIYVVVGEKTVAIDLNKGVYLPAGVYRYNPYTHSLKLVKKGDLRKELSIAALGQEWVRDAAVDIVITANFAKTTRVYGQRGVRYVYMEAGHAGQNIYLEAAALGLGTVVVGAFYDEEVQKIIGAPPNEKPLYIVPVGVPKKFYTVGEEEIAKFIAEQRKRAGYEP